MEFEECPFTSPMKTDARLKPFRNKKNPTDVIFLKNNFVPPVRTLLLSYKNQTIFTGKWPVSVVRSI